jgi:2-polyprenyl-6-methoxyphenol hydroxylase-like FAD-dependent oxidoreductase
LEEMFPGLTAELVADGALVGSLLADARMYLSGHRLRQTDTGLVLLCASRPFLEAHVRARVRAHPNVTLLDRCDVVGLATTPDNRRVIGVRVLRRADSSAEEVLAADLVIDASGRGSRTPVWLESLGYPRPELEQVRIGLAYATRIYRLPTDALHGDLAILDAATPQLPRTGALLALEGDRWMLTLAGILGDHPPIDPDGFLEFARSLRFPDIHEAIREAEPLDDPVGFRFPASARHRYERLHRFPAGFLVVGDAVCSFNPIYGQGMSVAALEALMMRRLLEQGIEPQPSRWFRDLARVVDVAWNMSAGGDLIYPGVEGRRTFKVQLLSAYLAKLHAAAAHDARLATAFIRVSGLVAPPQSLLHPSVVLRVLRKGGRSTAVKSPEPSVTLSA